MMEVGVRKVDILNLFLFSGVFMLDSPRTNPKYDLDVCQLLGMCHHK